MIESVLFYTNVVDEAKKVQKIVKKLLLISCQYGILNP